jgi:alpha-N-acetylglucosamine transferase
MLDKFRVLGLTEYRRVLFMDGDVMPTENLDYLFELSDGPDAILKPNLIVTGSLEPANGGFFMLSPGEGELEEMNEIIHQREVKAQSLPYPYFDDIEGWGHEIQPPDKVDLLYDSRTNWTFWAAFADQGLLYYWVRTVLYCIDSGCIITRLE